MIPDPKLRAQLKLWWIVWAGVLGGLLVVGLAFGRGPVKPAVSAELMVNLIGVVPLFLSIIIRWLMLPRFDNLTRAFPLFIFGLAQAEGCGILGIFLGGPYRDSLFVLGVLAVTSYVPVFAKRLA